MVKEYSIVLSVAGSDSSSGAGVQADLKSITACGSYCTMAITALTAQNTCRVNSINVVADDVVHAQIEAVVSDFKIDSIKLGMLPSVGIVKCVKEAIIKYQIPNVVLDPVMISTSGDMLVDIEVAQEIIRELLPLSKVVTPNISECEFITGMKINRELDFPSIAKCFKDMGSKSLLLKGSHLGGDLISDYLYNFESDECDIFEFMKIKTLNTHGTGCSLSSSISAYLSQGYDLFSSVSKAESYIHSAISAATYKLGDGFGPINHFYELENI